MSLSLHLILLLSIFIPQAIAQWWDLDRFTVNDHATGLSNPTANATSDEPPDRATFNLEEFLGCTNVSLTKRQFKKCKRGERRVITALRQGVAAGHYHCEGQFKYERWNCTAPRGQKQPFGNIVNYNTAESAYSHAITAAAVTYSIIQACNKYDMSPICGCEEKNKLATSWLSSFIRSEPCASSLEQGLAIARRLIDKSVAISGKGELERQLINHHNNRAGWKAVEKSIVTVCRCWGLEQTADCPIKACYKQLKHFKEVASYLKSHYKQTVRVKVNRQQTALRNRNFNSYPFTDDDLVYSQRTRNLCQRQLSRGVLGVHGRECNTDRQHAAYCNTFCCGFGYKTQIKYVQRNCNCRFIWMPKVKMSCDRCSRQHSQEVCK